MAFLSGFSAAMTAAQGEPAPVPALPAPSAFVRISDDELLAHADVRSIVQDQQGFIWLGLRLGGLARYDGYELKVHEHDPANPRSLGNRVIWSLLVDRQGTLWIGTEGGLDRYDRATDTFVHYRHDRTNPRSLPHNVVVCLFEDGEGHLWAGTRGGLSRLDDSDAGQFTTFVRPQVVEGSAANNTVRSIMEDPVTGLFWLGTSDGLAAFDRRTGAFATFIHDPDDPQSLSRNSVNKVLRGADGTYWALTEFGFNAFRPTFDRVDRHSIQEPALTFQRFWQSTDSGSPGTHYYRDGRFDRHQRLWLASRGGLQVFDLTTGQISAYRRRPGDRTSLSDDFVQCVFEDRSGNLWVGTYAGGANLLRTAAKPFRVHRHEPNNPQSLSEDRVTGLAFDSAGRLWASTAGGLNRFDGTGWTRFLHDPDDPRSLPSNDLSTVTIASNDDVWVGTNYRGVFRFDHRRFHGYEAAASTAPAPDGWHDFSGSQVNSLLPDQDGGVWLAARAYGLDYYRDGRFRHYAPRMGSATAAAQPTNNATLGEIEADGSVWYVTEAGRLVRLDRQTQQFRAFEAPTLASGVPVSLQCLESDGDGTLWVGATEGLLHFDPRTEKFTNHYSVAQGLPNPAVTSLVRDRRGELWIGTANGLARFNPATGRMRSYDRPDGLPSNGFSQSAAVLGPDGRVYLGTRAGIVDFAPEELQDNPVPPPVVLTELRWLGRTPPHGGSHPASVLNVADHIEVPPGRLGFALKFSALDFTAPEKNRFRHRLEGWDEDWVTHGAQERSVTFTALPPGEYTFRVQASNADGIWNERGAAVRITVLPRLWQTVWFRLGVAAVVLGLIGSGLQWRLRAIRHRNALLESQVSQRTAQLQREIAVRQQAEADLRESHAALESRVQARTAELAETNASLQAEINERTQIEARLQQSQKMEAIGQLAGGVAHDFNNLLTVILGQIGLMESTEMSAEERAAAVRDITAAAQRATNLTRQLLVFSRQQAMSPVTLDLNRVVSDVCKLLHHVIGERITVCTRLHLQPLGVRGDPGMLEQVLINLALNARDAMPRGGQLTIEIAAETLGPAEVRGTPSAQPGPYAHLRVSDTGTGIDAEILPKIFEPFFTTKESGKGTGLGLAISLGIVQKHGGWIKVESQPGHGSTFHLYLPSHPLESTPPESSTDSKGLSKGDTTILLAEDEDAVRLVVKTVLTRQGYRVIEAGSGSHALTAWSSRREEISLLLTDIVMPGELDGHELAARLAAEKPEIRIVTMSGYDPTGEATDAPASPTRAHLRKPFTADHLLRVIESTLKT